MIGTDTDTIGDLFGRSVSVSAIVLVRGIGSSIGDHFGGENCRYRYRYFWRLLKIDAQTEFTLLPHYSSFSQYLPSGLLTRRPNFCFVVDKMYGNDSLLTHVARQ